MRSLNSFQAFTMAYSLKLELQVFAVILVCITVFCCDSGKAEEAVPEETGVTGAYPAETGVAGGDPTEIVEKALLCFNDKYIYSSCEESYRLSESGNLKVPQDYTDEYCNGPCLAETHLVLNCIENILSHFVFYNKATIKDVKDTIKAGCGHGQERGNFNVVDHIQAAENRAHKAANRILFGFGLMILVRGLLLG